MDTAVIFLLLYPAIADLKHRRFYLLPPALIFACFFAVKLCMMSGSRLDLDDLRLTVSASGFRADGFLKLISGAVPGAVFWLLSRVSRGSVGSGDAVMILFMGILCGFETVLTVSMTALFLTAAAGLASVAAGKGGKNMTLPFLPFLLAGYVIDLLFFK